MKKVRSTSGRSIVLLVIIFLVVVLGGRYYFVTRTASESKDQKSNQTPQASSDTASEGKATSLTPEESKKQPELSCKDKIQKGLTENNQSYAKGSILVTFSKDLSYTQAKDVLSSYNIVVQNEIDSQNSFSVRKLITAAVAPGSEINKICELKNDSRIVYAGLNLYFNLHE